MPHDVIDQGQVDMDQYDAGQSPEKNKAIDLCCWNIDGAKNSFSMTLLII